MGTAVKILVIQIVCLLSLAINVRDARAEPFELVAQYRSLKPNSTEVRSIALGGRAVVMTALTDMQFEGIFFRYKTDDASKIIQSHLERVSVGAECEGVDCRHLLRDGNAEAFPIGKSVPPVPILAPNAFENEGASKTITFDAHAKFNDDFLCQQEIMLRLGSNTSVNPAQGAKVDEATHSCDAWRKQDPNRALLNCSDDGGAKSRQAAELAEVLILNRTLQANALVSSPGSSFVRNPILFSFCRPLNDAINPVVRAALRKDKAVLPLAAATLDAVLKLTPTGDEIVEAEQSERDRMGRLLREHLKKDASLGDVRYNVDNPRSKSGDQLLPNLFIYSETRVTILKEPGSLLSVEEIARDGGRHKIGAGTVIDQSSTVVVGAKERDDGKSFCRSLPDDGCATFFAKSLRFYVETVDTVAMPSTPSALLSAAASGQTSPPIVRARVQLQRNTSSEWTLGYDWRTKLKSAVDLAAYVAIEDREYEVLRVRGLAVENLGLVTSFPIISEVVGLIQKHPKTASDVELQSSIPVSAAFDLATGTAHAAVTVPWMIGYNARGVPRLADMFRVFPHISFVFPSQNEIRAVTGVGLQLANVFTFSVAFPMSGSYTTYLMTGVSVPDLVKALDAIK